MLWTQNMEDNFIAPNALQYPTNFALEQEAARRQMSFDWVDKITTGMSSAYMNSPGINLIRNTFFMDGVATGNKISAEEANAKYPVELAWEDAVDEGIARYKSQLQSDRAIEQMILDSPAGWFDKYSAKLGSIVGYMGDPANIPLMALSMSALGTSVASRLALGAVEGGIQNALLEPVQIAQAYRDREPYGLADSMANIGLGAGAGFGFAALGMAARYMSDRVRQSFLKETLMESQVTTLVDTQVKARKYREDIFSTRPYQEAHVHTRFASADEAKASGKHFYIAIDDISGNNIERGAHFDSERGNGTIQIIDDFNKSYNAVTSSLIDQSGTIVEAKLKPEAKLVDFVNAEKLDTKIRNKIEEIFPEVKQGVEISEAIRQADVDTIEKLNAELRTEGYDGYYFEGGDKQNPHNTVEVLNQDMLERVAETKASLDTPDKIAHKNNFKAQADDEIRSGIETMKKEVLQQQYSPENIQEYETNKETSQAADPNILPEDEINAFFKANEPLRADGTKITVDEARMKKAVDDMRICLTVRGPN